MDYKDIEEHILKILKDDNQMSIEKDVKPLIKFYFNVYTKLTKVGFIKVHNLIVKNEPESLMTNKEENSILNQYAFHEKNYIKALFVLYVSEAELAVY